MRSRSRLVSVLVAVLAAIAVPHLVHAAGGAGSIRGRIVGPDSQAVAGAELQLRNDITGFRADTVTGADGSYQFFNVPMNPYELHVDAKGFQTVHQSVDIRSAVPLDVPITLQLTSVSEKVTVMAEGTAAQLETDSSVSHVDIDKSYIARAPATLATRAMEELITATPGFAKDENGRYHFQGAHSQGQFVIDGQTISD